jgi:hypothetical protein
MIASLMHAIKKFVNTATHSDKYNPGVCKTFVFIFKAKESEEIEGVPNDLASPIQNGHIHCLRCP